MAKMYYEKDCDLSKLNGKIPYVLVRGNHDKTLDFNKFFPKNETPYIDGTYDVWINNSWRTVRMGGYDYLIITLDYGADDDMLSWASGVIEDHPNHNVIIATHSYLCEDGTTLDADDDCPPSLSGGTNEAMEFTVRAWCKNEDYWDVYFDLTQSITEALGEANVQAPAVRVITK